MYTAVVHRCCNIGVARQMSELLFLRRYAKSLGCAMRFHWDVALMKEG